MEPQSLTLDFRRREEEHEFYLVTHIKIYNSGYSTDIVNAQCNTGDPLETSGGLFRVISLVIETSNLCTTMYNGICILPSLAQSGDPNRYGESHRVTL